MPPFHGRTFCLVNKQIGARLSVCVFVFSATVVILAGKLCVVDFASEGMTEARSS